MKTDFFQFWVRYKSGLHIFIVEKHKGFFRIKHFKTSEKRQYRPHY